MFCLLNKKITNLLTKKIKMKKSLLKKNVRNLRTFLSASCLLLGIGVSYAQAPSIIWTKAYGGTGDDVATTWLEVPDAGAQGYIIGGTSNSSPSANGSKDYYIFKLDKDGNKITIGGWEQVHGGNATDELVKVIRTSDGGYILAGTSSSAANGNKQSAQIGGKDFWLVKLNSSGVKQWDKTYGTVNDDELSDIISNGDGTVTIAGTTTNSTTGKDYHIIKINNNNTVVSGWDKTYSGANATSLNDGADILTSISKNADGWILGGYSRSQNANQKSQTTFDDGNMPAVTNPDYWVVFVGNDGTKKWDFRYGGNDEDRLEQILPVSSATSNKEFLLLGVSRSGNTGNKNTGLNVTEQMGEHLWWVKVDATLGISNPTRLLSQGYQEVHPNKVRSFFENLSATRTDAGYYVYFNTKELAGTTRRIDFFNWSHVKQWSQPLYDFNHIDNNRKLFQLPLAIRQDPTKFKIDEMPYQSKQLYQAFLNNYADKTFSPAMDESLYSLGYPNEVNMYGIRGSKTYQNYIKQFIENGIYDPRLIQIIYEWVQPITSKFKTNNLLWPAGKPIPGATDASGIVTDPWASDLGDPYGQVPTGNNEAYQRSAKSRRMAWNPSANINQHPYGNSPTALQRESPKYKEEKNTTGIDQNRIRLLNLREKGLTGVLVNYGTESPPLDFQLGGEFLFWAGYILDVNSDIVPNANICPDASNYGDTADDLWNYLQDWEEYAEDKDGAGSDKGILGARPVGKDYIFNNTSHLHHSNTAMTSLFQCMVKWYEYRNGSARAKDVAALKRMTTTVLDDIKLVPILGTAPETENYNNAFIANYTHKNQAIKKYLDSSYSFEYGPGDMTYLDEFESMLGGLYLGEAETTDGRKISDSTMRAISNMCALIVELGPPGLSYGGNDWRFPGNVTGRKKINNATVQEIGGRYNNQTSSGGPNFSNLINGANGLQDTSVTGKADQAVGGFALSWDINGRHFRLYDARSKGRAGTPGGTNNFNVANILSDPTHVEKKNWNWLSSYLMLSIRRPEVDLLNPQTPYATIPITNPNNQAFVHVSTNNNYFSITSFYPPTNGYQFSLKKYGNSPLLLFSPNANGLESAEFGNAESANKKFKLTAYPNPTDSRLNLMISNGQEGKAEFSIVNVLGVMVKVFSGDIQSSITNIEVDVASLAPGVYTLQMRQGGNTATSKLVIN